MNSKNLILYLSKNIIARLASPSNILKGLVAQNTESMLCIFITLFVFGFPNKDLYIRRAQGILKLFLLHTYILIQLSSSSTEYLFIFVPKTRVCVTNGRT